MTFWFVFKYLYLLVFGAFFHTRDIVSYFLIFLLND